MASIIRVICFRGRAVKCGLRVFSIAMISFMVSLGVNAVLEAVFYLLWPFFFLRYLKITHADWRRYCQNKIIKIFSIAAVVFLPPTLVASIYGMNFQYMPELDLK